MIENKGVWYDVEELRDCEYRKKTFMKRDDIYVEVCRRPATWNTPGMRCQMGEIPGPCPLHTDGKYNGVAVDVERIRYTLGNIIPGLQEHLGQIKEILRDKVIIGETKK